MVKGDTILKYQKCIREIQNNIAEEENDKDSGVLKAYNKAKNKLQINSRNLNHLQIKQEMEYQEINHISK